jgi:hypothetical protein
MSNRMYLENAMTHILYRTPIQKTILLRCREKLAAPFTPAEAKAASLLDQAIATPTKDLYTNKAFALRNQCYEVLAQLKDQPTKTTKLPAMTIANGTRTMGR